MTNAKTLMLAAAAALTIGVGTAMAQESATLPPYETSAQRAELAPVSPMPAQIGMQPQAGSSDVDQYRTRVLPQQVPQAADGNG